MTKQRENKGFFSDLAAIRRAQKRVLKFTALFGVLTILAFLAQAFA